MWIHPLRLVLFGLGAAIISAAITDFRVRASMNDAYPFAANKHAHFLWSERMGQTQYVSLVQVDVGVCVYWLSEYPTPGAGGFRTLPATCPQAERAR